MFIAVVFSSCYFMKISGKEQPDQSLNSWQSQLEQLRICNNAESALLTLAQRIQLLFEPSAGTNSIQGKGSSSLTHSFNFSVCHTKEVSGARALTDCKCCTHHLSLQAHQGSTTTVFSSEQAFLSVVMSLLCSSQLLNVYLSQAKLNTPLSSPKNSLKAWFITQLSMCCAEELQGNTADSKHHTL